MLCSVEGCQSAVKARVMCARHYYRWAKYGDPAKAAFYPAAAGEPVRFLEDLPLEGEGCVLWPYAKNNHGYGQINTAPRGKKTLAHRISCQRKNGPPPSLRHQAAHSCGMGHMGCVAPWHLSWKTPAENQADRKSHGTHLEGPSHPQAKLSEADMRKILSLSGRVSHQEIARQMGVSQSLVSKVVRGERCVGRAAHPRRLPQSGIKGVRQMPNGKWQARKSLDGKMHQIGTFSTREEAAQAVLDWIEAQIGVSLAQAEAA